MRKAVRNQFANLNEIRERSSSRKGKNEAEDLLYFFTTEALELERNSCPRKKRTTLLDNLLRITNDYENLFEFFDFHTKFFVG